MSDSDEGIGCITDVDGIAAGHHTDREAATGCTVVLPEGGATGGVDVRGGYPGTRDTDMLDPSNLAVPVDAVLLSGGSNLGLGAASGVVEWLTSQGRGSRMGRTLIPRVPAAVIFDFGLGDPEAWPDHRSGHDACVSAGTRPIPQGSVGAGTGAAVGRLLGPDKAMKGGIGSASTRIGGAVVGAVMVSNPIGSVHGPDGAVVAGPRAGGGPLDSTAIMLSPEFEVPAWLEGQSTVIGVVATDAALTPAEATRVARMAQSGVARTVRPVHTDLDGDAIFCLSTGRAGRENVSRIGAAAAEVTSEAILNAVATASGLSASVGGVK